MQSSPTRDLAVGLFVLGGLLALAYLTFQVGGLSYKVPGGFVLYATFDDIGGLKDRAPVSVSGVKVGQVTGVELDELLRARVEMDLAPGQCPDGFGDFNIDLTNFGWSYAGASTYHWRITNEVELASGTAELVCGN